MKTSNEAYERFKMAADALSDYEMRYRVDAMVARGTSTAEAKDECSVTILTTWKLPERLPVTLTLPHLNFRLSKPVGKEKTTVEFLIHRSLIDDSPAIVKCEPAHRCGLRY